jgi:hypothetical protein
MWHFDHLLEFLENSFLPASSAKRVNVATLNGAVRGLVFAAPAPPAAAAKDHNAPRPTMTSNVLPYSCSCLCLDLGTQLIHAERYTTSRLPAGAAIGISRTDLSPLFVTPRALLDNFTASSRGSRRLLLERIGKTN